MSHPPQLFEKRAFLRTDHPTSRFTHRNATEFETVKLSNDENNPTTLSVDAVTSSIQALKATIKVALRSQIDSDCPVIRQWASEEMETIPSPTLGSSERTERLASIVSDQQHAASLLRDAFKLVEEAEECLIKAEKEQLVCSPIRTVPPELLGRIFVDVSHDNYFFDVESPFPNPLLRVCRRWRRIALNTPGIWSQIQLNILAKSYIYTEDSDLDDLDACLSRAKSTPLDISFRMDMHLRRQTTEKFAKRAVETITHHARVFGSLDFSGHVENLSTLLASPAAHSLRNLAITHQVRDDSPMDTLPLIALPKLQSFYLDDFRHWDLLHSIQAPALSTLTLKTQDVSLEELELIDSQFPRITALCIEGTTCSRANDSLNPQFRELLQCDWLIQNRPAYDMRLFGSATQLTMLTINYVDNLSFLALTPLPSLLTLRLFGEEKDYSVAPKPSLNEMFSFLKCCPNVTDIHLVLVHPILGDALLRLLSLGPRSVPPQCTTLKHLFLDKSPVSISILASFMKERNRIADISAVHHEHDLNSTRASGCLLSTQAFRVSQNQIALPDMDRASQTEVDAALETLPLEALKYLHSG